MSPDPYHVLGIPPGATLAEIKRAYRALVKTNHPDSAGEAALPRFLAIQQAYEHLLDPRRRVPAASAGTGGGAGARRPATGPPTRPAEDRSRAGSRPGAGEGAAEARSGPRRSSTGPSGARPESGPAGNRRRATRKATPGSTTYGGASDPDDTSWEGSSWYGQSSGEYWRVNPREYADPRKHGPDYQARAASGRAAPATARSAGPETARGGEPADAGAARPAPTAAQAARAPRAARPARPSAQAAPAEDAPWVAADDAAAKPFDLVAAVVGLLEHGAFERQPLRRLILAFIAWPPIGIAAAALIGEMTGCATFSASCTGGATAYPWLAQLLILGILLAIPAAARLLVGGSLAVLIMAFPIAATLSASGANYDRTYGPASLIGLLAVAWIGGVILAFVRRARGRILTS